MNRPNLIMAIGIPGSGKSQMAEDLSKEYGAKICSSDKIREELFGSAKVQQDNNKVFSLLENRIRETLKKGENCVYDATNINAKRRKAFLESLNGINCCKQCIFMATDLGVCLQRNNFRERKVPYHVIKKMYMNIDIPQYREGWDKIHFYKTENPDRDYNIGKFIQILNDIPHDNPHHTASIGEHISLTMQYIYNNYLGVLPEPQFKRLLLAAVFHDIGKKFTKTFENRNGETTDIAHYYNHEKVSAYEFLLYSDLDSSEVLYVADLISLHMRMFGTDKEIKKLANDIGAEKFKDLCILHMADISAE